LTNQVQQAEKDGSSVLFLFDTTPAAMEAEEAIIDGGVWCDVVPRPPQASSTLCGLAIEIHEADREDVSRLLQKSAIAFKVFEP
jgi:hypothetical protein